MLRPLRLRHSSPPTIELVTPPISVVMVLATTCLLVSAHTEAMRSPCCLTEAVTTRRRWPDASESKAMNVSPRPTTITTAPTAVSRGTMVSGHWAKSSAGDTCWNPPRVRVSG